MTNTPPAPVRRIAWLDALRVLCCYLVIVNHSYDAIGIAAISRPVRLVSFMILFSVKIAVPIFLMISGWTLLRKEDTVKKSLSRFARIALVYVVFSAVYEINSCGTIRPAYFLETILTQPITNAYWYLITYAGLLLMLPFLQKIARGMRRGEFFYYFAVSILFISVYPMAVKYLHLPAYSDHFRIPLFGTHVCYVFLGYFLLHEKLPRIPAWALVCLPLLCAAGATVLTEYSFLSSQGTNYLFMDNIALPPTLISSACVFLLFSRMNVQGKTAAVLSHLGRLSFGVYLLSDLVLMRLEPVFDLLMTAMHPLAAVTLYQLLTFAVSLAGAQLLTKIPLIRKLV
ncbi:MAG: acyltransferase family protein [Clostridia bacterium]|nr:acyltransferase family protein [Clostridia bacterium]